MQVKIEHFAKLEKHYGSSEALLNSGSESLLSLKTSNDV